MPRRTRSPRAVDFHEVAWPRGRRIVEGRALARRLPTLEGKTVAFLWDSVFRGDEIFPILQTALTQRFDGVSFVQWDACVLVSNGMHGYPTTKRIRLPRDWAARVQSPKRRPSS